MTYGNQKVEKDLFYNSIVKIALLLSYKCFSPMGLFWKGGNAKFIDNLFPHLDHDYLIVYHKLK